MPRGIGRLAALTTLAMLAAAIGLPATTAAARPADAPRLATEAGASDSDAAHPRNLGRGPEDATQPSGRPYVPGVVLVAYRDGASASARGAARRAAHAQQHHQVSKLAPGLERLRTRSAAAPLGHGTPTRSAAGTSTSASSTPASTSTTRTSSRTSGRTRSRPRATGLTTTSTATSTTSTAGTSSTTKRASTTARPRTSTAPMWPGQSAPRAATTTAASA